jgi:hypothetical protein
MYAAKGINDKDAGSKLKEFLTMGLKYGPVNAGPARTGDRFMVEPQKVLDRIARATSAYVVYDNREKTEALVADVVKADLGLSVIVSGLFDEVDCMCEKAGIRSHTTMCSLGVWGKTDLLPKESEILDIATMCGHSMVGFNLIRKIAEDVRTGQTSLEDASRILARPCSCGVFNPARASEQIQKFNRRRAFQ